MKNKNMSSFKLIAMTVMFISMIISCDDGCDDFSCEGPPWWEAAEEIGYEFRNDSTFYEEETILPEGSVLFKTYGPHENRYRRNHGRWVETWQYVDYEPEEWYPISAISNYRNGVLHGWQEIEYVDGTVGKHYYRDGNIADPPQSKIVGSYSMVGAPVPSYNILTYKYPWFIFNIAAYGIDSSQVINFMSSVEAQIAILAPLHDIDFAFSFIEAMNNISDSDTLTAKYFGVISSREVFLSSPNIELRRAVIDRYIDDGESTFEILRHNYNDFLDYLFINLNEEEIKSFIDDFDSIMDEIDIEDPLDPNDPEFLEEIDNRINNVLTAMFLNEEYSEIVVIILIRMLSEPNPVYQAIKYSYFTVSVEEDNREKYTIPLSFLLEQNYPNPFNPSTIIRYAIPEHRYVRLTVYNTAGQLATILVNEEQDTGHYEITFDASSLPSGVYIYRLQAGEYVESKKLLYLK